ncbi:LIC10906 family membrane protein [Leptospira alstonii]|uniref:Membrane protein n=3 Tax=Leptospira alstonii TaxID=28452 RepID=T0G7F7_9LEPT|nr:histidine kinase N-terminal 7TM domain-containing protein [Leptospira alstonii]EMJ92767.1 putative membrane protein [Leptospira alstonii serovar Sichuan str. 79601]EQA82137.1 putative membrane protein [Leptospira alstonii serovar Pingchang str. 80-412]
MVSINIYNVSTGIFLLFLGVYILRIPPGKSVQKHFFGLCLLLAFWMFGLGFRGTLPTDLRGIVLNWILIPVLFIPIMLYTIVNSIFGNKNKLSKLRFILNFIVLPYLLFVTSIGDAVKIQDPFVFSYHPTINYHLIIAYSTFYVSLSCISILQAMIRDKGDERVRAFLLLSGIIIALFATILCVYVFPLLGLFYSSKLAVGLLPFSIIWAVAILHYDAFEIREHILEGEQPLPLLNRIASIPILKLFWFLDREEYYSRIISSKANVIQNVTHIHHELLWREEASSLNAKERAELLARIFSKRIR